MKYLDDNDDVQEKKMMEIESVEMNVETYRIHRIGKRNYVER